MGIMSLLQVPCKQQELDHVVLCGYQGGTFPRSMRNLRAAKLWSEFSVINLSVYRETLMLGYIGSEIVIFSFLKKKRGVRVCLIPKLFLEPW